MENIPTINTGKPAERPLTDSVVIAMEDYRKACVALGAASVILRRANEGYESARKDADAARTALESAVRKGA